MSEHKIQIKTDASDLKKGIGDVLRELNSLSGGIVGSLQGGLERAIVSPLGAVVSAIGAIVYSLHTVVNYAREITRLSARGMSQRQAAGFITGAEKAEANPEALMGMMNRMRGAQSRAMADDTSVSAGAFRELGMSMEEVGKMVPLELFLKLTKVLEDGNLSGAKFSAMTKILGRDFTELTIAAQKGLVGKIEGGILGASDEKIEKAKELENTLSEGKVALKQGSRAIGNVILDGLNSFMAGVADIVINGPFIGKEEAPLSPSQLERRKNKWFAEGPQPAALTKSEQQEAQLKQRQLEADAIAKEKRERIKFLTERAETLEEGARGFKEISPDKFARMGLYLTKGTEKLSSELVVLNRQNLSELKAIKAELKTLNGGLGGEY